MVTTTDLLTTTAERLGRYQAERDILLRGILAVHAGLADGTATAAWRDLLRTARWLQANPPALAAPEAGEVGG